MGRMCVRSLPCVCEGANSAIPERPFVGPKRAVLCTMHHRDDPENGVTVHFGNSEAALATARYLGFCGNSLLVFEADGRPRVVLRHDRESHERIDLTNR
jgi:hypothetical protein